MIKLYVGGLSFSATDKDLANLFATYGDVVSAVIVKDQATNRSKGFGFVEMRELKEGQNAVKSLNGQDFMGRNITVNPAKTDEEKRRNPRTYNNKGKNNSFRRTY